MESLLQGLKHVAVCLDDILITWQSEADHLRTLEDVLGRLEAAGMRLKAAKWLFMQKKVEYLGHRITSEGIHPAAEKLRAIKDAPAPQQLRSFLGLINYFSKFLPHLVSLLVPLYTLLVKDKEWSWGKAIEKAKELLTASMTHFDSCDAVMRRITLRSLATAERNYSQLDKEGLAIIFGVKKFHNYLYRRQFSIVTDHKPLIHLFSENRSIPAMASARLQRWALVLSAYQYKIVYKCGKDNANAVMLSRLPLPECPADVPTPGETMLLMETLQSSPVSVEEIRTWTKEDPVLSKVKGLLINGWKGDDGSQDLRPCRQRLEELSLQDDCILWGCRVVIPKPGQRFILEELHSGHQGISKMKSLARSFVWWPKLDADIEEKAKSCQLHPELEGRIKNAERRQKRGHDKTVKQRTFTVGDNVPVLNFGSGPKWLLGTFMQMRGPVSVQVRLTDGRRHLDQVRNYNAAAPVKDQCQAETVPANSETHKDIWYDTVPFGDGSLQSGRQAIPPVAAAATPPPEAYPENEQPEQGTDGNNGIGDPRVQEAHQPLQLLRSTRARKCPSALQLNWDFRNISKLFNLEFTIDCYNPSITVDGNNRVNLRNLASSMVLINISKTTINTSCEVCIVGNEDSTTKYRKVFSTKVVFSFDTYCASNNYNISSNSQTVMISSNATACFSCFLPGLNKSDIWQVNGKEISANVNQAGSLIVANLGEIFGSDMTTSILSCGKRAQNTSITATIFYKGLANIIMTTSATFSSSMSTLLNTNQGTGSSISTTMPMSTVISFSMTTLLDSSQEYHVGASINTIIPTSTAFSSSMRTLFETSEGYSTHMNTLELLPSVDMLLSSSQDTSAPLLGAIVPPLILLLTCSIIISVRIRAAIKRQSKHGSKSDIFQLKMVLVKNTTLRKVSSTLSITTYLDKLQPAAQMTSSNNTDLTQSAGNVSSAEDLNVQSNITQPSSCVSKCASGCIRMPEVRTHNEEILTPSCTSILESPVGSSAPICLSEDTSVDEMSNLFFRFSDLDAPAEVLCITNSSGSDATMDYVTSADHKDTTFDYIDANQVRHEIIQSDTERQVT
ncbi:hypothetical protein EMCRGX_G017911 [Ephydatia muelleri]